MRVDGLSIEGLSVDVRDRHKDRQTEPLAPDPSRKTS